MDHIREYRDIFAVVGHYVGPPPPGPQRDAHLFGDVRGRQPQDVRALGGIGAGRQATVQDAAHRVVCCRFGRRDDEAGAQVALGLRAEAIRLRDKAIEDINKRYEEDEASKDSTFNGYDVLSDDDNEAP